MNENHFDEKYFDRVSRNLHEGCNLAREDRRFYMTVLTVVAATAFITLPKPKQKQATSKEKEPASKEHGEDENEEN